MKYTVIYERAPNNWAAYVPDLPGCITTGKTLDETKANIREAIEGHLETLRKFGSAIREPATVDLLPDPESTTDLPPEWLVT